MGSPAAQVSVIPQDLDAEETVLGAILLSPAAIEAVIDTGLTSSDFYRASHGTIFDAAVRMFTLGEPVEPVPLADRLHQEGTLTQVGGRERIQELAALVPATGNVGRYATIIRDQAVLRGLVGVGEQIQRLGWDRPGETSELLERAEQLVFDLGQVRRRHEAVMLREALRETFAEIEKLFEKGEAVVGVPTGFGVLDRRTAGLQPGNLVVLAARPSMGKTALALAVASHVIKDRPVAIYTMEMNSREVTQRLLAMEARVELQNLRTGTLDSEEWKRVMAASARLDPAPLLIDESAMLTALELRSKARRLKMRHPDLSLIVVDYLQLMTSGERNDSRQQDVSAISRSLKVLASELDVPVLVLSQLNRACEQRHDKRPMLSDLRESGAIEQDADLVMFLYRDDYYAEDDEDSELRGIAELNIAKQRNGPTGVVKLAFVERYASFTDLAMP